MGRARCGPIAPLYSPKSPGVHCPFGKPKEAHRLSQRSENCCLNPGLSYNASSARPQSTPRMPFGLQMLYGLLAGTHGNSWGTPALVSKLRSLYKTSKYGVLFISPSSVYSPYPMTLTRSLAGNSEPFCHPSLPFRS